MNKQGDVCGDSRFEEIEKVKMKLLDYTNIGESKEEMAVIDSILFRFWQMGWIQSINKENGSVYNLYDILSCQQKEVLKYYFLMLLKDKKISFSELAEAQNMYLESCEKIANEKLMHLRYDITSLWNSKKKDFPKALVALVQKGKDEKWINISQEQIDNSKWNK